MSIQSIAQCTIKSSLKIPIYLVSVSAGFPSPAQDYVDRCLDLNELCIQHPASTYFVRVEGESMIEAGIIDGDILVVDRSLKPRHEDIVIASVNGEMTVKTLELKPRVRLVPKNPKYQPIEGNALEELSIFGVVSSVVRTVKRSS